MYLFDTDIISQVVKARPCASLIRRLEKIPKELQFITAITVGEIYYGAWRVERRDEILRGYEEKVFPRVNILAYDADSGRIFGRIKSKLEKQGRSRGETDLQIAAIALQYKLTLVTGNIRHFAGIPFLKAENWLED